MIAGSAYAGVKAASGSVSVTLAPVQTAKGIAPPAPLKPVVVKSGDLKAAEAAKAAAAQKIATGTEARVLPRPDWVPDLSWKTLGLFAGVAAGLGFLGYLLIRG